MPFYTQPSGISGIYLCGGSKIDPDARAYITRVQSDGGAIVSIPDVALAVANAKFNGYWTSVSAWYSGQFGVKKDGSGYVSKLYDLSPNNHDVTQSTGVNQPQWVTGIQNGKAVIKFVPTQYLTGSFGFASSPFILALVIRQNAITDYPAFLAENSGSSTGYLQCGANVSGGHQVAISNTGVATSPSNLIMASGTFYVISYESAGISGGAVTVRSRMNGTVNASDLTLTGLSSNPVVTIGGDKGGASESLNGDICGMVLLGNNNDSYRASLETFLNSTWGVF